MNFFNELLLIESQLSAKKEAEHVVSVVNSLYTEWKKTGRRKNAVDIITTTANKLSNIDPTSVDLVHEATRLKMATLIIRCFDIPYWKNVGQKEKIYKKLFGLIKKLENYDPNTGTGGNLRSVIMTRLSASVCYNSDNKKIFVAYEPKISTSYLRYLFGQEPPERTYRMQTLMLPDDFANLVDMLHINHEKAVQKFNAESGTESNS